MKWTEKDTEHLRNFRYLLDSDDIKLKQEVKQRLLSNKYIVHVLNNKDLEDNNAEPDDYFGLNIRPYYMVPEVQTEVQNYICYETSAELRSRWETVDVNKYQQIIFYILVHPSNIIDESTSIARHDLLAALIIEAFNFKIFSCGRIQLISDKPLLVDSKFQSRVLTFQSHTDSNLVKNTKGSPRIINKDVINGKKIPEIEI